MSTTVAGGAYQRIDKEGNVSWFNANGEPIDKATQAEAEKIADERGDLLATQERDLINLTAMRDPVARALLQQQALSQAGQAKAQEPEPKK